jgi:transglycosylase-like protein with SLT domain
MPLPRLLPACLVTSLALGLALVGCRASPGLQGVGATDDAGAPVSEAASAQDEHPAAPSPAAWLPRRPARLAARLTETTRALHAAIGEWRTTGGTAEWPPPRDVVLLALDQQRIYQLLVAREDRLAATIRSLPWRLRSVARDTATAGTSLRRGLGRVTFDGPITMRTRAPLPPDRLRGYYEEAARRFHVPWTLLAAINFVESRFGRVVSPSWAGARGPMQFIPSTWEAYGMGGEITDPHDAIRAAANYLSANGAPGDNHRAVLAYNPVDWYADAVLRYERQMRRDVHAFYSFYNWQVFVRLRSGLVQVTGPGADAR